jgi:hypothetical protein
VAFVLLLAICLAIVGLRPSRSDHGPATPPADFEPAETAANGVDPDPDTDELRGLDEPVRAAISVPGSAWWPAHRCAGRNVAAPTDRRRTRRHGALAPRAPPAGIRFPA